MSQATIDNQALIVAQGYLAQVDMSANLRRRAESCRSVAGIARRDAAMNEDAADNLRQLAAAAADSEAEADLLEQADKAQQMAENQYAAADCLDEQASDYETRAAQAG